jgi:hypothetical protein
VSAAAANNGLHALALQAELRRHQVRVAELQAMRSQLDLLDEVATTLQARGLTLNVESIGTGYTPQTQEVHVRTGALDSSNWALLDALFALGFKETRRTEYSTYATVRVRRGPLRLRVHVSSPRLAVAA